MIDLRRLISREPRRALLALGSAALIGGCGTDGTAEPSATVEFSLTRCDGEQDRIKLPEGTTAYLVPNGPGSELTSGILLVEGSLTGVQSFDDYLAQRDVIVMAGLEDPAKLTPGNTYRLGRLRVGLPDGTRGVLRGHELRVERSGGEELRLSVVDADSSEGSDDCEDAAFSGAIGQRVSIEIEGKIPTYSWGDECFSPTSNAEISQELLPIGCACDPDKDKAVCVSICEDAPASADCPPQAIAMFCGDGRWTWGYDGPCE